jgi:DNA sulfur modification protein DndD
MFYKELRITNFKRFAGTHVLPLMGKGKVTIIAAKNGVGKTTVLDAFNLALHGKKGIESRYSDRGGFKFNDWVKQSYNTTLDEEDRLVGVQLSLIDEKFGEVTIQREYWFNETSEPIEMELTVRINGNPVPLEEGETKHGVAQKWIEAFIPLALSQRFLFDGEKLPDVNMKTINLQLQNGLDDILGQGAIHRLNGHLHSIMKTTTRQMTPEDERDTLDQLYSDVEIKENNLIVLNQQRKVIQDDLNAAIDKEVELKNRILSCGEAEGESLANVRAEQAVAASALAGRRKELIETISTSLPFIIAGVPFDLGEWEIIKAKEALENTQLSEAVRRTILSAFENINPKFSNRDIARMNNGIDEELLKLNSNVPTTFQFLCKDDVEDLITTHAILALDDCESSLDSVNDALLAFDIHEKATESMLAESAKHGLADVAEEYRMVAHSIGELRGEINAKDGDIKSDEAFIAKHNESISNLNSATQKDSKLNKRIQLIVATRGLIGEYAAKRRESLAKPLQEAFAEGFKLLSRKSKDVKEVRINSIDYSPWISMKGYDGNWLDRDLSATEVQHVSLSMLYAIVKTSSAALPVVVDTPVSRMDKEHKGWSVTRFYPQLSEQIIVLTTSDDLANGLYDELKAAGIIGAEVLLESTGPATAKAVTTTLENFF